MTPSDSLSDAEKGRASTLDSNDDHEPDPALEDPVKSKQCKLASSRARFSTYRVNFTLVFIANLLALAALIWKPDPSYMYSRVSNGVAANVCASVMIRNEHIVNGLFMICCHVPKNSPLALRTRLARVFGYGGIHSGCAVAAVAWYVLYIVLSVRSYLEGRDLNKALIGIDATILVLFIVILTFAYPWMRVRLHNWFELTHRLAGWTLVFLFWAEMMLLVDTTRSPETSLGGELVQTPAFWLLVTISLFLVYPWTRLRKRKVSAEKLSEHALRLHFDYGHVGYGMALKLARQPLRELHPFAAIPKTEGRQGFSVIISNAGDWTGKMIEAPPKEIWTRGVPQYGVLRVAGMFKPVLIIATGSGIGPCLSLFVAKPQMECRVLWSTRDPVATYGQEILDQVYEADEQACIIDTSREHGRPDLVMIAQKLYQERGAEAAVVISNQAVTRRVVAELNKKGIPAFGPIFDS